MFGYFISLLITFRTDSEKERLGTHVASYTFSLVETCTSFPFLLFLLKLIWDTSSYTYTWPITITFKKIYSAK